MTERVVMAGPERTSMLTHSVGRIAFRPYVDWLQKHVGQADRDWRVKYETETGIRTVVIFRDSRHKFMFDIAWAGNVTDLEHSIVERITHDGD